MSNETMLYIEGGDIRVGDKTFRTIIVDADNSEDFDAAKAAGYKESSEAFAFLLEEKEIAIEEVQSIKKKGK
jgi:hypothetical protein